MSNSDFEAELRGIREEASPLRSELFELRQRITHRQYLARRVTV